VSVPFGSAPLTAILLMSSQAVGGSTLREGLVSSPARGIYYVLATLRTLLDRGRGGKYSIRAEGPSGEIE
jgi:hypothetical protein